MAVKRILIFYISVNSGHQMAAMAIEDAIRILDRNVETLNINHFNYTNPVLARLIMRAYHGMLRKTPEIWEYLYDNPVVKEKTSKIIDLVYKLNTKKIHRLIQWYQPDLIICTQAFPCVAIAEYNRRHKLTIPVVGVVTDYGIHSYWADRDVDLYIVPTAVARDRLVQLGIDYQKIEIYGIPINPRFYIPLEGNKIKEQLNLNGDKPIILIMGGSRGLISIDKIVAQLAGLQHPVHLIAICGANRILYKQLIKLQKQIDISLQVFGYVSNMEELMSVADIVVTKPGGITITECLAKGLPLVIVDPIPGQEKKNAEFLLENGIAYQAKDAEDVAQQVGNLLAQPLEIERLRQRMADLVRKNTTFDIAKRIIYWDQC